MELGDQEGAFTPCDDSRVQRKKKDTSSLLAKTQPMKSYGLFYYTPPNFLFPYKSILLSLPHDDLHMVHHGCRPQIATFCWFWINQSFLENYLVVYFQLRRQKTRRSWESQFLSRLIRSLGSWGRERGLEFSRRRKGQMSFFSSKLGANDYMIEQLILLKDMFFLRLCSNDYITTMYPAWEHVSPS